MRTTLTLDDDNARRLRDEARRTGRPFKQVVNEAIRSGLTRRPPATVRYRLKPASLGGVVTGADVDKALRLADALEDDAIARKLESRK